MSDLLKNHMSSSHTIRAHAQDGTKIKGDCLSGRKVVPHDSKSDLPLVHTIYLKIWLILESFEIGTYFHWSNGFCLASLFYTIWNYKSRIWMVS